MGGGSSDVQTFRGITPSVLELEAHENTTELHITFQLTPSSTFLTFFGVKGVGYCCNFYYITIFIV